MENEIIQHLIDIKTEQASQGARLDLIERAVSGNGQPGLAQKVERLEAEKNWVRGIGSAVVFFWGTIEWYFHRGGHK